MKLRTRIRYWLYGKTLKTFCIPLQNNIYAIKIKNGKYTYVHIPDEKELQFPIQYAEYFRRCANTGFQMKDNKVKVDEEKLEKKKKDWLDENKDKDPEELV